MPDPPRPGKLRDAGAARGTSWVGAIDGYARPEEIPAKVRAALGGAARAGLELGAGTTLAGLYVFEDMIAIGESGAEVLSAGLARELTRIPA